MSHWLVIFSFIFIACKQQKTSWELQIPEVTSTSSPQCTDLNQDGVLDIIIGAGGNDWEEVKAGIIAIDGANGKILWYAKARNQITGKAIFQDINADGIDDVFIGGKSAELQCLDGRTGTLLWEFYSASGSMDAYGKGWHTFYDGEWISDLDGDQINDLLICNGGDLTKDKYTKQRLIGKVLIISAKTGRIIVEDFMPDGAETYFSPKIITKYKDKNARFLIGTGGEYQSGKLFLGQISDLLSRNFRAAVVLDSAVLGYKTKPILWQDKILVSSLDGTIALFNKATNKPIWKSTNKNQRIFIDPMVGRFTQSTDEQLAVVFSDSAKTKNTLQLFELNNGEVILTKQLGKYNTVVLSKITKGKNDVLITVQQSDSLSDNFKIPNGVIYLHDFEAKTSIEIISTKFQGVNEGATPWIGNLDNDDKLDLIFTYSPMILAEKSTTLLKETNNKMLIIKKLTF